MRAWSARSAPTKRSLSQVSVQAASAPTFADFDGDGLVDLLLGQRNGEILFVRNVGSAAQPQFGGGGCTVGARAGPSTAPV